MTRFFLEKLLPNKKPEKFQCHYEDPGAVHMLGTKFGDFLTLLNPGLIRKMVIVGVGTDRSTGDSLGPLVGTKIKESFSGRLTVYGTLDEPVHAGNLSQKLTDIENEHPNSFIVAVDASLGKPSSIGQITLSPSALKPGTGVKKDLPLVGEIHFTGIINVAGHMEYFVLQNTRLSLVMRMADSIARSIIHGYHLACSSAEEKTAAPLGVSPEKIHSHRDYDTIYEQV
jgi:putative sporulation protein YyaC